MTIDGPYSGDPLTFSLREIGEMRWQLVHHADDPFRKVCVQCGTHQCRKWRAARMLLVAAGLEA